MLVVVSDPSTKLLPQVIEEEQEKRETTERRVLAGERQVKEACIMVYRSCAGRGSRACMSVVVNYTVSSSSSSS